MNTIFMNFDNSKTSDEEKRSKRSLRRKDKYIALLNIKYQLQHLIKDLNYLMDHILYQIFYIILNIYI